MTLTVNEVLERFPTFDGRLTEVVGLLAWRFENQSLEHAVMAELSERSKLWLEVDNETPPLDDELLTRWEGKRVIVTGVVRGPDPKFGGCGHFSLWPAELLVRSIRRE
jgi:hypothetical protein